MSAKCENKSELFSMITPKTRQFTCDPLKYHAGNSNYVVHTYQIFVTVFTTQ